jgi:ABC-type Na+ efflux pump permease subunit
MMALDLSRVAAVVRKELRDYRRKRSIVVGMLILPAIFLIEPVLFVFLGAPDPVGDPSYRAPLLLLLLIPVITPSTLAAYSVAGEREQGTLEPLLTTPIRQLEFIIGKAAAVMIPSVGLSYLVFGIYLVVVRLFANPVVAAGIFNEGPMLLALFLFTPLLTGWSIVVGMAVSVRAGEIRVAQQLGMIASLPPLGVVVLMVTGVIAPTFTAALVFAAVLLAVDVLALRGISGLFDRERLVTGSKASRP